MAGTNKGGRYDKLLPGYRFGEPGTYISMNDPWGFRRLAPLPSEPPRWMFDAELEDENGDLPIERAMGMRAKDIIAGLKAGTINAAELLAKANPS